MDSLGLLGRFKDLFSFKITNSFSGDSFKNIFSTILRGYFTIPHSLLQENSQSNTKFGNGHDVTTQVEREGLV